MKALGHVKDKGIDSVHIYTQHFTSTVVLMHIVFIIVSSVSLFLVEIIGGVLRG